jgi:hypothetical protein
MFLDEQLYYTVLEYVIYKSVLYLAFQQGNSDGLSVGLGFSYDQLRSYSHQTSPSAPLHSYPQTSFL